MAGADIYQCGHKGLRISRAKLHGPIRQNFVAAMKKAGATGVALLQGGQGFPLHSTDNEYVFRQESYFFYLFGVLEEGFVGMINLEDGRTTLFMPKLPEEYAVWMGRIATPDEVAAKHAVDAVHYVDEVADVILKVAPKEVHILDGKNTDSGLAPQQPKLDGLHTLNIRKDMMFNILTECRVFKTPEELEIMQYTNKIASAAHVACIQSIRPGDCEYDIEAEFLHSCYRLGGARMAAYTPICASGPNGAVLHYGHVGAPNDRTIQDGDIILADMGCEYYGYDSDITTTWPANGKFSDDQKIIYNAVLAAHRAVIHAMRPGVSWPDMHRLAERKMLEGLLQGGFVTGNLDAMLDAHIGAVFMPCGLGHLIGLDTHDVGGYLPGTPLRIQLPGVKNLRTARVLEAGMVMTVEPGIYFNHYLLDKALDDAKQSQFLVADRIRSAWDFGGVRLEDAVIITPTGAESMTDVPRTVDEVEAVVAGAPWPPAS